jgi:hypothetical protein
MKMKKIFKIKVILVLALILGLGSCTKDWEGMNTNPNEPVVVPPTNLLAYALRYYSDNFVDPWMSLNNTSTYANHVAKIQYIDESRYQERESVINDAWRDIYTTLLDLKKAKELAEEAGNTNLQGAVITMQAFLLQKSTDLWRNVPWTDALLGEEDNATPAYDSQESIYAALLQMLVDANDLFNQGTGDLGDGDLLYHGDVLKWQKFCNSMRLRVAIRMSNVAEATAKQHIEQIMGDAATYPIFGSNDDNAFFYWPGNLPYMEPWAEDMISNARDDHGMCETLVNVMLDLDDPRLPVYAHPAPSDGEYRGLVAGAIDGTFNVADISRIGERYRDNPAGFSPFMRYSEVLFIAAEAAFRGFSVGIGAQDAYEAAVTASCEENGVDASGYLAGGAAWNNTLDQIYLQKWISLFKQGHEAWAENRRTDVPVLDEAPGSPYGSHNRPPFRFPYPTDESNLNGTNLAPNLNGIQDRFWGTDNGKMWWDTRTGVQ